MMPRREDWPLALTEWVDAHRATPFEWGGFDCCSAAAAWVRVCTGADFYAAFAGRYDDALGAERIVRAAGGIKKIVTPLLGEPLPPAFAQRGDLVLVDIEGRESLAVCVGGEAAGPGEGGLVFVAPEGWLCAWRV